MSKMQDCVDCGKTTLFLVDEYEALFGPTPDLEAICEECYIARRVHILLRDAPLLSRPIYLCQE